MVSDFGVPELIILCVYLGEKNNKDITTEYLFEKIEVELPLWLKIAAKVCRANTSRKHEIAFCLRNMCEYDILDYEIAGIDPLTKNQIIKFRVAKEWKSFAERMYNDRVCFSKLFSKLKV